MGETRRADEHTGMHTGVCTHAHTHAHPAAAAAIGKRCAYKLPILWPRDSRGETGSEGCDQKWKRDTQGCASKPCPHQGETWASIFVSNSGRKVKT